MCFPYLTIISIFNKQLKINSRMDRCHIYFSLFIYNKNNSYSFSYIHNFVDFTKIEDVVHQFCCQDQKDIMSSFTKIIDSQFYHLVLQSIRFMRGYQRKKFKVDQIEQSRIEPEEKSIHFQRNFKKRQIIDDKKGIKPKPYDKRYSYRDKIDYLSLLDPPKISKVQNTSETKRDYKPGSQGSKIRTQPPKSTNYQKQRSGNRFGSNYPDERIDPENIQKQLEDYNRCRPKETQERIKKIELNDKSSIKNHSYDLGNQQKQISLDLSYHFQIHPKQNQDLNQSKEIIAHRQQDPKGKSGKNPIQRDDWLENSNLLDKLGLKQDKSSQNYNQSDVKTVNKAFDQYLNISSHQSQSEDWLGDSNLLDGIKLDDSDLTINQKSVSYVSSIDEKRSFSYDSQKRSANEKIEKKSQYQNQNEVNLHLKQDIQHIIQESLDYEQKDVCLEFQCIENIEQFKIKEIEIINLNRMNLGLTSNQSKQIIVKNSLIQIEKLAEYISFYEIQQRHPHMPYTQPLISNFKFCRIKVPKQQERQAVKVQSSFIKKPTRNADFDSEKMDHTLILVKKMKLKCMSCGKSSEVPVIYDNSAKLSCRHCHEKMEGLISKIYVKK